MSVNPSGGGLQQPGDPSNRWPWVVLGLGVLILVVVGGFFMISRSRTVNVNVEGTPTPITVALAATPTVSAATRAPTATSPAQTPTPVASPTRAATVRPTLAATAPPATPAAAPTQPPAAASLPTAEPTQQPAAASLPTAEPTQPPAAAAPPIAEPTQPQPTTVPSPPAATGAGATQPPASTPSPATPTAQTGQAAATATPSTLTPAAGTSGAPPTSTPFAGQVANPGGLGNARADLEAAYGPAVGETPAHLVVFRKNNLEFHVGFVPDPNGRAALLVELPQSGAQPWTLDAARAEARKLLPKDAQPPNPQQEGNDQFVVERYLSQSLAAALPASVFAANQGQPGQFLAVYARDPAQSSRILRIILGPGTDPAALLTQGT